MRIQTLALAALALLTPVAGALAVEKSAPPVVAKSGGAKYDETKLKVLEAKLTKAPKDVKLKTETAEANFQVGHAMMINPELPPRVKYRGALKFFRRSLELNPKHAGAAADKKQIEDVYKSMGMPIPQ